MLALVLAASIAADPLPLPLETPSIPHASALAGRRAVLVVRHSLIDG